MWAVAKSDGRIRKAMDYLGTNRKSVHTGTRGPLYLGVKKRCVHISAQSRYRTRVPFSGITYKQRIK